MIKLPNAQQKMPQSLSEHRYIKLHCGVTQLI